MTMMVMVMMIIADYFAYLSVICFFLMFFRARWWWWCCCFCPLSCFRLCTLFVLWLKNAPIYRIDPCGVETFVALWNLMLVVVVVVVGGGGGGGDTHDILRCYYCFGTIGPSDAGLVLKRAPCVRRFVGSSHTLFVREKG